MKCSSVDSFVHKRYPQFYHSNERQATQETCKREGAPLVKQTGRKSGAKGYNNEMLYLCVKEVRPLYIEGWGDVCELHLTNSPNEFVKRDAQTTKTHWLNSKGCTNKE